MTTHRNDTRHDRTGSGRHGLLKMGILLAAILTAGKLFAVDGPVTWVRPDPETQTLRLESHLKTATLSVTDPETGKDVNTPEKLYERGWIITKDVRAAGSALK